jgi:hypothetical protein
MLGICEYLGSAPQRCLRLGWARPLGNRLATDFAKINAVAKHESVVYFALYGLPIWCGLEFFLRFFIYLFIFLFIF